MRGKWTLIAAAAVIAPTVAAAQARPGLGIIPAAGFTVPGTLAEGTEVGNPDVNWAFKPQGSPVVGAQLEYGLSKNVSIGVGGSFTIGQTLDVNYTDPSIDTTIGEADISTLQVYGAVSLRPQGRRPNGTVTPLAIEAGGGLVRWGFTEFKVAGSVIAADDWNASTAFAFAGVAYNVPIGPRASIQLFGRGVASFGYSSQGLDDFNATSPPTNVEGKTAVGFTVGAGLRVGR
ncbi:MAG: hypothetical protein HYR48_01600 [Gemmatimonadetes bacterium]|nr:hypothetical protein [Gemmatimonadota bacterium]